MEGQQRNGFGIASVFFGVFSILFIWFPFIGLVFAALGLVFAEMQKNRGSTTAARFGLVLSIIGMVFNILVLLSLFFVIGFAVREAADRFGRVQDLADRFGDFEDRVDDFERLGEEGVGKLSPEQKEEFMHPCKGDCVEEGCPGGRTDPLGSCPGSMVCCFAG